MSPNRDSSTQNSPEQKWGGRRAFRVKLRGAILVLIQLPNRRQVRGSLHQLSVTGGVINLEQSLDETVHVELVFHINGATIRGQAEMLFPMWATQGWLQPFRFTELAEPDRQSLELNLRSLVGESAKGASAGC